MKPSRSAHHWSQSVTAQGLSLPLPRRRPLSRRLRPHPLKHLRPSPQRLPHPLRHRQLPPRHRLLRRPLLRHRPLRRPLLRHRPLRHRQLPPRQHPRRSPLPPRLLRRSLLARLTRTPGTSLRSSESSRMRRGSISRRSQARGSVVASARRTSSPPPRSTPRPRRPHPHRLRQPPLPPRRCEARACRCRDCAR